MKVQLIILMACIAITSCATKKEQITPIVGADLDAYGCKASAGQTWSKLKQTCIQVFNVGTRLNPIDTKNTDTILSAFVVISDNTSQLELFLPYEKDSFILNKNSSDHIYTFDKYAYNTLEGILYINHVKTYSK